MHDPFGSVYCNIIFANDNGLGCLLVLYYSVSTQSNTLTPNQPMGAMATFDSTLLSEGYLATTLDRRDPKGQQSNENKINVLTINYILF